MHNAVSTLWYLTWEKLGLEKDFDQVCQCSLFSRITWECKSLSKIISTNNLKVCTRLMDTYLPFSYLLISGCYLKTFTIGSLFCFIKKNRFFLFEKKKRLFHYFGNCLEIKISFFPPYICSFLVYLFIFFFLLNLIKKTQDEHEMRPYATQRVIVLEYDKHYSEILLK